MARSQRSSHQKHLIGAIEPASPGREGEARWSVKSLCGDKYAVAYSQTDNRDRIERVYCDTGSYSQFTKFEWAHDVCGACQSKYLAKKLKAEPIGYVLGERFALNDSKPFGISKYTWKSVYPVIDTGVLADADDPNRIVAFVCIESGWGKSWEIRGFESAARYGDYEKGDMPDPRMGDTLNYIRRYEISGEKRETKSDAKRFASKEYALMQIPSMIADGLVPLRQDIINKDRADMELHTTAKARRVVEDEARRVEREKKLREMQADKGHVEDAFRQMIDDETLLSNYQRQGIFMAAKLLGIDLLSPPTEKVDPVEALNAERVRLQSVQRQQIEHGIEQAKTALQEVSDDDFSY
jgi:hypothetical protein